MNDQRERGHQRAVLRDVRQQVRMVLLGAQAGAPARPATRRRPPGPRPRISGRAPLVEVCRPPTTRSLPARPRRWARSHSCRPVRPKGRRASITETAVLKEEAMRRSIVMLDSNARHRRHSDDITYASIISHQSDTSGHRVRPSHAGLRRRLPSSWPPRQAPARRPSHTPAGHGPGSAHRASRMVSPIAPTRRRAP